MKKLDRNLYFDKILNLIRLGNKQNQIVQLLGISLPTFNNILKEKKVKWKALYKRYSNPKLQKFTQITKDKSKEEIITPFIIPPLSGPHTPIDLQEITDPYMLEIMSIQQSFKTKGLRITTEGAIKLKTQSDKLSLSGDIPPWFNPPIITQEEIDDPDLRVEFKSSPLQLEIMNAVAYGPEKCIMIEGTKRTGKSTYCWLGVHLAIWNGTHKRWRFYGASETNAMDIHEGIKNDPLTIPYTAHLQNGDGSKLRTNFFNGGFFQVMSTGKGKGGERRSSGTDCDAIWIDESHSVLIEAPKTLAMAAMILLAQPNIRMVFSMNREGAAYEMFKNLVLDKLPPEDVRFITITHDDVYHITQEANEFVRVLVEASAGEDMARQYLDNEYVREDGLYYPQEQIQRAFIPVDKPSIEQYDKIVCTVDWGDSHDTAMLVLGFLGPDCYEEDAVYFKHPTSTDIVRKFALYIREYPGIIFIWETSPLGAFARNEVRSRYPSQKFIDSQFTKYKQKYLDNIYIWLVDENLHLTNGKLKRQLLSFCNDKKNDDGHDALAHGLYKAVSPRTSQKISVRAVNK